MARNVLKVHLQEVNDLHPISTFKENRKCFNGYKFGHFSFASRSCLIWKA